MDTENEGIKTGSNSAYNLFPALVNAGSDAYSAYQANKSNKQTIVANKELAEYQYSKDLEMWNRGNEYNTPEAQMERINKAGLNPNLVYGGNVTGNVASNLPKYQAPTVSHNRKPYVDPMSMLSAYMDVQVKQAQIDNLKSSKENTDANTTVALVNARAKEFKLGQDKSWEPTMRDINWRHAVNLNEILAQRAKFGWNNAIAERDIKSQELLKYQQEVRSLNLQNDIKQMELQFLNKGGKFFAPVLQAIKLFTGK